MTQDADILFELRDVPCVRGVWELASRPSSEWPRLVVEMATFDAYDLAVVTSALIRAIPDSDRSHIGVIWTDRMREVVFPRARRLVLDAAEAARAADRARARPRAPRPVHVYLDPFRETSGVLIFHGDSLRSMRDPFRSPALPPPLVVVLARDEVFRMVARLIAMESFRLEWRTSLHELDLAGHDPYRIYVDEELAPEALAWLAKHRAADLERTFIVCDEHGRDWVEGFVRSLGTRVEVLTLDEVPDSLREH